jgi:hypothetical protein
VHESRRFVFLQLTEKSAMPEQSALYNAILITLVKLLQQLDSAHRVFTWSDAELEWATRDGRRRQGVGAAVIVNAKMVDMSVIQKDQEILWTQ